MDDVTEAADVSDGIKKSAVLTNLVKGLRLLSTWQCRMMEQLAWKPVAPWEPPL